MEEKKMKETTILSNIEEELQANLEKLAQLNIALEGRICSLNRNAFEATVEEDVMKAKDKSEKVATTPNDFTSQLSALSSAWIYQNNRLSINVAALSKII